MSPPADVIIIGGGVAGLEAASHLTRGGLRIILLEARNRLGGRIWTKYVDGHPIELGAEFVHGRPPDILNTVSRAGLKLVSVQGRLIAKQGGEWVRSGNLMEEVNALFENMPADQPDQTFANYIAGAPQTPEAKEHALNFVQGFHAADPKKVGVHWLVQTTRAEEEIDGEHSFRLVDGYEAMLGAIEGQIDKDRAEIHLQNAVTSVDWEPGKVTARTASSEYRARYAVIAVPLSLLKARAIRFDPALAEKDNALGFLEMGLVVRVSLHFREKFWDKRREVRGFSFMFTDDVDFPTWWSLSPLDFPVLTGWTGGSRAAPAGSHSEEQLVGRALGSLARILEMTGSELRSLLQSAHAHNWEADPYSRGAYSYARAGGAGAFHAFAAPLAATLFFAGEATEFHGFNGTVHGAMASGRRVAAEIIGAAGSTKK